MRPYHSFSHYLLMVTLFSFIQHFANGRYFSRDSNATIVFDNSTTQYDTPLALTRGNYEKVLADWKASNPHLVDKIETDAIEALWEHMNGNTPSSRKRSTIPPLIRERQPVTQSDIDATQKLLVAALVEVEQQNTHLHENPQRNSYLPRPTNNTSTKKGPLNNAQASPLAVNETIATAAAVVAEADIAALIANGTTLFTNPLTGKYAKFNQPSFPSGSHLRKRDVYYWFEDMDKQFPGNYPFGDDSEYYVFRNVRDFGATGNGNTDDTVAINNAIAFGNRCGSNCGSSSVKGAIIYFPEGIYLVSSPIIALYNTQLVGNANSFPTIRAAPQFTGLGVITSDVYLGGTDEYYINTNNFYRQIRYLWIDLSLCTTSGVAGIHWQVAQATSITNVVIQMTSGGTQVGIFAENGSGGFMSDLIFINGYIGIQCGNQQFTTRNLNFLSTGVAIWMLWDWGWTWKSITTVDVGYGIYFAANIVGGSIYVVDSTFTDTTAAIVINSPNGATEQEQILISLSNVQLTSVTYSVFDLSSNIVTNGGTQKITSWVLGKVYDDANPQGAWVNGAPLDTPAPVNATLQGGPGYFERSKPSYGASINGDWLIAQVLAKGDGVTDDTASLSFIFAVAAAFADFVFVPTGSYIIATPPLVIPINSVIVGACWAQFVAKGSAYSDMTKPTVMIKVGNEGDLGNIEIQDVLFTTVGPTQGAVLVEWNARSGAQGTVAMWDSHFRIGGALGTNLQAPNCPTGSNSANCIAASLAFHVTSGSNGYFENVWVWTADHDMDSGLDQTQVNVFTGRGMLIESSGPCWFYATASEHAVLYQYNIANARDIYMAMIQTESPYYPPFVTAPAPFTPSLNTFAYDPDFSDCQGFPCAASWALTVTNSDNIQIDGAGLYSWFQDYNQACVDTQNCQSRLVETQLNGQLYLFNVYTIGSVGMIYPVIYDLAGVNSSVLTPALAAPNSVENAHPFLSAVNAWIEIFPGWSEKATGGTGGDGSGDDPSNPCSFPHYNPSLGNVTKYSLERNIGKTLYYFLQTTEQGELGNWVEDLWALNKGEDENCGQFNGDCVTPYTCGQEPDPDYFWVKNTVVNWHEWADALYTQVQSAGDQAGANVKFLVETFPVDVPAIPSASDILNDLGSVFGIAGGALSFVESLGPAGTFISLVGTVLPFAASQLDASDPADTAEATLSNYVANITTAFKNSISSSMQNLVNGNVASWPGSLFSHGQFPTGNNISDIANFFDYGAFFWSPSDWGLDTGALEKSLLDGFMRNLAGQVLISANWYILNNAYSASDCANVIGCRMIGGSSFSLEQPGPGNGFEFRKLWSVPIDNNTFNALTGAGITDDPPQYDVTIEDLYSTSLQCQQDSGGYGGKGNFSFNALNFNSETPDCFYSLPVFFVSQYSDNESGTGLFKSTPCEILVNSVTGLQPGEIPGENYLPPNLDAIYSADGYCCFGELCYDG